MYNRYIPQPDGSYQKKLTHESVQQESKTAQNHLQPPPPTAPKHIQHTPTIHENDTASQPHHRNPPKLEHRSITDFFKQLLPKDLDTADLIIILLFLLMAADREENKSNALLTLALYFFM